MRSGRIYEFLWGLVPHINVVKGYFHPKVVKTYIFSQLIFISPKLLILVNLNLLYSQHHGFTFDSSLYFSP